MDELQSTATTEPSTEELLAALRVRGHIQRVRADAHQPPHLAEALTSVRTAGIGADVGAVYQSLLELAVATEATLTRLLVSHPDLKPRPRA